MSIPVILAAAAAATPSAPIASRRPPSVHRQPPPRLRQSPPVPRHSPPRPRQPPPAPRQPPPAPRQPPPAPRQHPSVSRQSPPAPYTDDLESAPPPYADCESQSPSQLCYNVDETEVADELPEYSMYDEEHGSLIDRMLAQYARSISPDEESGRCTITQSDDDDEDDEGDGRFHPNMSSSGRLRHRVFYYTALFFGVILAMAWAFAIGYAIVASLHKLLEDLL